MISNKECKAGQTVVSENFPNAGPGVILRSYPDPERDDSRMAIVRFDDDLEVELACDKLSLVRMAGAGRMP